ncbi:MAG: phosphoribosyltransferase family protein [Candidatus Paceibacterota bacterium]|jgi:predicted phosphoribosyltransferase
MPSNDIFKDRKEAGRELAELLQEFKDSNSIVLALPRGGVITGKEVANELNLPLDIIVTRKIGAPKNAEYSIGAIDVDGDCTMNEDELSGIDIKCLEEEKEKEFKEAKRRWALYRGTRGPLVLTDKIAIIVDDGIATGMTIRAAANYAKKLKASKIIVASPVAPPEVVNQLKDKMDLHVLKTPSDFFAIGAFYEDFPQINDEEVIEILKNKLKS